jgi:hypothetical protein
MKQATRPLMATSAAVMGAAGLGFTFLPEEIFDASGWSGGREAALPGQLLGALYLGFAILNWSARGNLLGGIYSRPIVLGNFLYFTVAALAMAKASLTGSSIAIALAIHGALAVWFGLVLFSRTPVRQDAQR